MLRERDAVLRELNKPWKKDPFPDLVLTVSGPGADQLTVEGNVLTVGTLYSADLTTISLGTLAQHLRALGMTVTVASSEENVTAAVLLDGYGPGDLARWSNPNWRLPDTFGRALEHSRTQVDLALAQLNLLTAGGAWADWWGRYTGTPRHAAEDDATYTARQLHELLRHRENTYSLADLLEEDMPDIRVLSIETARPAVFTCSVMTLRFHPLAGWRWNADTVHITVEGFPSRALLALAQANVAAGITVYLDGRVAFDDATVEGGIGYDFQDVAWQIRPPKPMQIGPGQIGVDKIGPDPGPPVDLTAHWQIATWRLNTWGHS
jgi:hypothetical protein